MASTPSRLSTISHTFLWRSASVMVISNKKSGLYAPNVPPSPLLTPVTYEGPSPIRAYGTPPWTPHTDQLVLRRRRRWRRRLRTGRLRCRPLGLARARVDVVARTGGGVNCRGPPWRQHFPRRWWRRRLDSRRIEADCMVGARGRRGGARHLAPAVQVRRHGHQHLAAKTHTEYKEGTGLVQRASERSRMRQKGET